MNDDSVCMMFSQRVICFCCCRNQCNRTGQNPFKLLPTDSPPTTQYRSYFYPYCVDNIYTFKTFSNLPSISKISFIFYLSIYGARLFDLGDPCPSSVKKT